MKNKDFFNLDHARAYLVGSLVMIKGRPGVVEEVESRYNKTFSIYYSRCGDASNKNNIVNMPSKDIDLTPVTLGFINSDSKHTNNLYYLARIPHRAWKIGLTINNIRIYQVLKQNIKENPGFNARHIIVSKALENTILGIYPGVEESKYIISKQKTQAVAFSRRFAIDDKGLMYKTIDEYVGDVSGKNIELFDKWNFLNECLKEDTHGKLF